MRRRKLDWGISQWEGATGSRGGCEAIHDLSGCDARPGRGCGDRRAVTRPGPRAEAPGRFWHFTCKSRLGDLDNLEAKRTPHSTRAEGVSLRAEGVSLRPVAMGHQPRRPLQAVVLDTGIGYLSQIQIGYGLPSLSSPENMLVMALTLSHVVNQRERRRRFGLWGNGPSPGSILA
eukprot:bmy_07413T0